MILFVSLSVELGFETEEQLENYVKNDTTSNNMLAAVVFEHPFTHPDEPLPLKVKGSIPAVTLCGIVVCASRAQILVLTSSKGIKPQYLFGHF